MTNLSQLGEWANELETGIANGTYDVSELEDSFVDYKIYGYKNAPDVKSVEDWLFQSGWSTNHDLSLRGGTDDVNYFASIGYLKAEGIAITQGFERYNARLNVDAKIGDRFQDWIKY